MNLRLRGFSPNREIELEGDTPFVLTPYYGIKN